jgi:DNA-binding transcriptional LysR family regulator
MAGPGATVRWSDLKDQRLLIPRRDPGAEVLAMLAAKTGSPEPDCIGRQNAGLDRVFALVELGQGVCLAFEGATGVAMPGIMFREVHDQHGPTRAIFHAYWRDGNANPVLGPFIAMFRERYPALLRLRFLTANR